MSANRFAVLDSDEEDFVKVQGSRNEKKKAKPATKVSSAQPSAELTTTSAPAAPIRAERGRRSDKGVARARGPGGRGRGRGRGRGAISARPLKHEGFDRQSGDVRKPTKRSGGGRYDWGKEEDQLKHAQEAEAEAKLVAEKTEGEGAEEAEAQEEAPAVFDYEEYLAQLKEQRQGEGFEAVQAAEVDASEFKGAKRVDHVEEDVDPRFSGSAVRGKKRKQKTKNQADNFDLNLLSFKTPAIGRDSREGERGSPRRGGGRGRGRGRGGARGGRGGARPNSGARAVLSDDAFPALGSA